MGGRFLPAGRAGGHQRDPRQEPAPQVQRRAEPSSRSGPVRWILLPYRPTQVDIAAAATWAQQVNPALGAIDQATVDQVHAHGMEIHVWTFNAGTDMRRAISWQVDGIITNYPQVLRDILGRT